MGPFGDYVVAVLKELCVAGGNLTLKKLFVRVPSIAKGRVRLAAKKRKREYFYQILISLTRI